ncbi:hypothetical protein CDAR_289581 [Caerostris darwini]|uniref:Uncharacterized protein n=1 Tax=Caerostris darwini TaxID=1538125 RepID=A0AAV4WYV4_9ARAC|nr:hypothetical protein CDAR_289581 [Caerostris darwini]
MACKQRHEAKSYKQQVISGWRLQKRVRLLFNGQKKHQNALKPRLGLIVWNCPERLFGILEEGRYIHSGVSVSNHCEWTWELLLLVEKFNKAVMSINMLSSMYRKKDKEYRNSSNCGDEKNEVQL